MSRGVEHLAVSVTGAAQRTLEVAIEVAAGGVTAAELPALILQIDAARATLERLEEAARTSAARDREIRDRLIDEESS